MELRAVGNRLDSAQVLSAYRAGLFPMGIGTGGAGPIGWWSPDRRGVLLPGMLSVSKSLSRSVRKMDVTFDRDFVGVMRACASSDRDGDWITDEIVDVYAQLHRDGWAHSVETWQGGELVGGLYGVGIDAFFAGESMFHRVSDASKVALAGLVAHMDEQYRSRWLIDTQWQTDHLASMGVSEMRRAEYLSRLHTALSQAGSPNLHMER